MKTSIICISGFICGCVMALASLACLSTNIADRNMLTNIVICADVLCFASALVGLHDYYKNKRFIH